MDWILDLSQNTITIFGALVAFGGFLLWAYRRVLRPIHKAVMAMSEIVEAQLTPNHGSSLVDRVARIAPNHEAAETHWKALALSQNETKLEVKRLTERLDLIESREENN